MCKYSILRFETGDPVLGKIKDTLAVSLGVITVVEKKREIYYIDNVKFHLDTVKGLGKFVEIEAIDTGEIDETGLRNQCENYMEKLGIKKEKLVKESYSDMMIKI